MLFKTATPDCQVQVVFRTAFSVLIFRAKVHLASHYTIAAPPVNVSSAEDCAGC